MKVSEVAEQLSNAVWLPRHRVRPNPEQPRREFNPAAMSELAESIRAHGILQPLLVRYDPSAYDGTPYIVIAGERRYRASEGILDSVPCIISDTDPATARVLALTENIQRQDLTAIEEARAIADLMTERDLSAKGVGRLLHQSIGLVNNRISLLQTGADVQAVAARVPYAMSSLLLIDTVKHDPAERRELLEAVENRASHAQIKSRVDAIHNEHHQRRDSYRAPDRQTEQRTADHDRNGGGSMSRGLLLTGPTQAEAVAGVDAAIADVARAVRSFSAWLAHLPPGERAARVEALRAIVEGVDGQ